MTAAKYIYAVILTSYYGTRAYKWLEDFGIVWEPTTTNQEVVHRVEAVAQRTLGHAMEPGSYEIYVVAHNAITAQKSSELSDKVKALATDDALYNCASPLAIPAKIPLSLHDMGVVEPEGKERVAAFVVIYHQQQPDLTPSSSSMPPPPPPQTLTRGDIVKAGRGRDSPSKGSESREQVRTQVSPSPEALYNYRPLSLAPPCVTAYFHPFKTFIDNMSQPIEETELAAKYLLYARGYVEASVAHYKVEHERQAALRRVTGEDFWRPGLVQKDNKKDILPDGVAMIRLECFRTDAYLQFGEVKNFTSQGDPSAQVQIDYHTAVSQSGYAYIRSVSCCPALLLSQVSDTLTVHAAVFLDRPCFERLAVIPMGPMQPTQGRDLKDGLCSVDRGTLEVARFFQCVEHLLEQLRQHYLGLEPPTMLSEPLPSIFPDWTSFQSLGDTMRINYLRQIPCEVNRMVFAATMISPDNMSSQVVVKFCASYGVEGHRVLEKDGYAPKLHHHAFDENIGMHVIVMDYVVGETAHQRNMTEQQERALVRAVQGLHSAGLVFGDLRGPNVILNGEDTIKLIDFEWCGRPGIARYPVWISMDAERGWAEGVGPWKHMAFEHDIHRVRKMCVLHTPAFNSS